MFRETLYTARRHCAPSANDSARGSVEIASCDRTASRFASCRATSFLKSPTDRIWAGPPPNLAPLTRRRTTFRRATSGTALSGNASLGDALLGNALRHRRPTSLASRSHVGHVPAPPPPPQYRVRDLRMHFGPADDIPLLVDRGYQA